MSAHENEATVMNLLRAEFQKERFSDFKMLRRIPSTNARKFLDYFSALDEIGKDALAEGLAERAFSSICPEADVSRTCHRPNADWRRYVDALPLMWDWRYEGVRELRMRLAVSRLEPESSLAASITDDVRKWIEDITPVKSAEIRKGVKLTLSQVIKPLTVTHRGQYWVYEGQLNATAISVTVDYSHRYHQLDYWVSAQDHKRGFWGLNFERLMGLACAHWDCLEHANLDQSIALLKEVVVYCAEVLHRLPRSHDQ